MQVEDELTIWQKACKCGGLAYKFGNGYWTAFPVCNDLIRVTIR
jgi:hypothetical protein